MNIRFLQPLRSTNLALFLFFFLIYIKSLVFLCCLRIRRGIAAMTAALPCYSRSTMNSTPPPSSHSSLSWPSWSSPSILHVPLFRVAVIGGGLGGLTLGQLLHGAANLQVTVYERSMGPDRLSGYRVMLSQFVLKKLQTSLRAEAWARVALSIGSSPKDGHELSFMKRWPSLQ
jgi:hypothetical protein